MFLDHLTLVLAALLKGFSLWFFVTALCFWKRPKPFARRRPRTRFACLIPARNEEAVVGALVRSLKAQNYPDALYDIYVIPNNCADGTEAAARAAGARILRCAAPVRCKGDVLRQAVARLLPRGYDAFCVFDADNVAHADFLARMNDAFCAGARVAKARMLAKNPYDSWVSGCYALYYGLNEALFNRSRAALGLSAKLVGTGFAVHRDVLARLGGWNTETIAEDAEFSAMCAALGERVFWVPEAVTFDEAPRAFRVSLTQRKRWCSGIMSAAELRVPRLLRALPGTHPLRAADSIFFLCAPFAQAFSLIPMLLSVLSAALHGTVTRYLLTAALGLALGYAGLALTAALVCRRAGAAGRNMRRSILLFPVFMASWLPLQIASLLRRSTGWKEIRHGGVMALRGLAPDRGSLF